MDHIDLNKIFSGRVLLSYVDDPRVITPGDPRWNKNMLVESAGDIIANLVSGQQNGKQYKIAGLYIEFENNGGAAVSVPAEEAIDRAEGLEYYTGLTGGRDYLRVPVIAVTVDGRVTTIYAQTQGAVGMNGEAFNDVQQSRVYGVAAVAFPQFSDDSQDLIYARSYFQPANQLIKTASSQIGITWEHTYG